MKNADGTHTKNTVVIPEKEDIKFMPYQYTVDTPPDPMVVSDDASRLAKSVAESINTLGVEEFIKRISVMTSAKPNDIHTIARREQTRSKRLVCPCCGKEFTPRYSHQRFCSGTCREENARRARMEFSAYQHDHQTNGKNVTINL